MESKVWHYIYYSYELEGRGYIGKRTSRVPPEEDPYLGSFSDKTFKPTHKIIIATYPTAQDALRAESALQHLFKVHKAEHFANRTIYALGNFGEPTRDMRWDHPVRYQALKERSEKLLELEAARPQEELDAWLPLIELIHKEQKQLIEEGRKDEMQTVYLLTNPFGLTLPITGLEGFCKNAGLDFKEIQKLFSGEMDSWEGWTRGEPCFPWNE
jgi:hypothetical protein